MMAKGRAFVVSVSLLIIASGAVAAEKPGPGGGDGSDQAIASLRILGADVDGSSQRCAGCHTLNMYTLNRWQRETLTAWWTCLYDGEDDDDSHGSDARRDDGEEQTPLDRLNCLRTDKTNPDSPFAPQKLGIYAAGAHTSIFADLFKQAYPEDQWAAKYQQFKAQVQMPEHGGDLMSEDEFNLVLAWTQDEMPGMERLLGSPGNPPTQCTPEIKPELLEHVAQMHTGGWEAKNRERGMEMFACGSADKLACFTQKTAAGRDIFPRTQTTAFGATWGKDAPDVTLRVLREIPFSTSYWMRSSPDGRFFASGADVESDGHGGNGDKSEYGGVISDLLPQLTGGGFRDLRAKAAFDPAFFPDGSGFMFQGTPVNAGFCQMSLLLNPLTTKIAFDEPECSGADNIDLYQSVGASLDGSDYLAAAGAFEGDGGSGWTEGEGQPTWMEKSYLGLTPVVNDGRKYRALPTVELWQPYLGDWTLAPSDSLIASRVSGVDADGDPKQMGYKFLLIDRQMTDQGYNYTLKDAGTVCMKGGKGGFSYDERLYAIFHYVDADDWQELGYASPDDAEFRQLLDKGSSNVYIVDLKKGVSRRITHMGPGQFALFPHFRSDGWLYFQSHDLKDGKRYAVASDAGILLEGKGDRE